MQMKRLLTAALCALGLMSNASHAGYLIDGNISDWGLHRTGHASDWTPGSHVNEYTVEDQTGGLGVYLTPGYGGQRYDAEAIYLDWDASNLYILLVTGLPRNNTPYAPGDFAIDFGKNGTFDFGVETTGNNGKTVGGIYQSVTWGKGLWNTVDPTSILSGTKIGQASLVYTTTPINNLGQWASDQHYVIETSIPVSAFGAFWGTSGPTQSADIWWTMNCGNDVIKVDPPAGVPEPGALGLVALGLAGLTLQRRRTPLAVRS